METIKQAIEFHKSGNFEEAEKLYREFLSKNPREAKAHHLLGLLYFQNEKYTKAIEPLKTALRLENSQAYETDLALAYFELSDWENSYKHLKKVADKLNSKIIFDKTIKCAKLLDLKNDVLKHLLNYNKLLPEDDIIIREIADTAFDLGELKISKEYLLKSAQFYPEEAGIFNNLGLITESLSDFNEAEKYYRKALEIKFSGDYLYNLAVVLRRMERFEESNACLMELKDNRAYDLERVEFAYSTNLLHNRDFKNGYETFARISKNNVKGSINFPWNGQIDGKSALAVCSSGGFGDVFMFTRYLDFINPLAFKQVFLVVPRELLELYKYNFPTLKVVTNGETISFGWSTIFIDLPRIFNLDFDHIPSSDKYLMAQSDYVEKHKKKFNKKHLNVGIFFAGNIKNKRTLANRNVSLDLLKPLFGINNVKFYSLQVEKEYSQALKKYKVVELSDDIKDFSDTAGIMENLDLVISTDSAPIHLAGALGKKAFLMLPKAAEWRWFDETKKTDWYKSVEIFKQEKEGDWTPVIQAIKSKIEELASSKIKK